MLKKPPNISCVVEAQVTLVTSSYDILAATAARALQLLQAHAGLRNPASLLASIGWAFAQADVHQPT